MSKVYLVRYTMEVVEEVEADSEEEAQQAFSELFGSPAEMVEDYGQMTVECLSDDEDDGQPTEQEEWASFDPDC